MSKSWDNAILKKLKTLMGRGLSTAEMGKRLGISKNAVVGKLHRMGWNNGAAEDKKESGKSKTTPKKVVAKKAPAKKTVAAPVKKATAKPAKKTPAKPAQKTTKKDSVKKVKPAPAKPVKKAPKEKTEKARPVGRAIAGRTTGAPQRIVQHALEMANLKPGQCRWPIGDPDSEGFHFCGAPVFVGKPYCYEHCKQAYQFTAPKKK